MGGPERPARPYYYASGKPVPLHLDDDLVAIDVGRASESGTDRAAMRKDALHLTGDLVLTRRDTLPADKVEAMELDGTAQPVYRAEGATLVVLPEVRVEDSSADRLESIRNWVSEHADEAKIVQDSGERIVLRSPSGRGADALALANRLTEQVGPEMAQPRLLRITRRPDGA
jgi:hypothetical protein